jgi:hypothetical protein
MRDTSTRRIISGNKLLPDKAINILAMMTRRALFVVNKEQ